MLRKVSFPPSKSTKLAMLRQLGDFEQFDILGRQMIRHNSFRKPGKQVSLPNNPDLRADRIRLDSDLRRRAP